MKRYTIEIEGDYVVIKSGTASAEGLTDEVIGFDGIEFYIKDPVMLVLENAEIEGGALDG